MVINKAFGAIQSIAIKEHNACEAGLASSELCEWIDLIVHDILARQSSW